MIIPDSIENNDEYIIKKYLTIANPTFTKYHFAYMGQLSTTNFNKIVIIFNKLKLLEYYKNKNINETIYICINIGLKKLLILKKSFLKLHSVDFMKKEQI